MFRCIPLLLLAASAQAEFDRYAGSYLPDTQITDEAAIDLDQLKFNEQLYDDHENKGMQVYTQGGHSGSFAKMTLTNLAAAGSFKAGTKVIGHTETGSVVDGNIQQDVSWLATETTAVVNVTYKVGSVQASYVACQVGGLYVFGEANRAGCFSDKSGSKLQISKGGSSYANFTYTYDQRIDNMNSRTLQGLSKTAETRFLVANQYFEEYKQFVDYYGDYDYADKFITAADTETNTDFKTGLGNHDFSFLTVRAAQGEAMKKGAAYLILWMEVAHQLAKAVDKCQDDEAVHHVDEAVAYYTGSLTTQPDSPTGILLYALADVRSHQAKTAGHLEGQDTGTAYVNVKVTDLFKHMKLSVKEGTRDCTKALQHRDEIMAFMKIPLIQGVLRYAHIRQYDYPETIADQERTRAEGAVFAATVLPFVHGCGFTREAAIIHENMRVESDNDRFRFGPVRDALEATYECLAINCTDVGGIWDGQGWLTDGQPCGGSGIDDDGVSVGGVFGIMFGLVLAGWVFIRYRHKIFARKEKKLPEMYTGNIAAVSEIS